jgi:hypothetical protein
MKLDAPTEAQIEALRVRLEKITAEKWSRVDVVRKALGTLDDELSAGDSLDDEEGDGA